jgi:hypothetical protein
MLIKVALMSYISFPNTALLCSRDIYPQHFLFFLDGDIFELSPLPWVGLCRLTKLEYHHWIFLKWLLLLFILLLLLLLLLYNYVTWNGLYEKLKLDLPLWTWRIHCSYLFLIISASILTKIIIIRAYPSAYTKKPQYPETSFLGMKLQRFTHL